MLLKNGSATVKFHAYKITPKSRFDTGTVKLDGQETPVKVTCAKHAKFPAYTYLEMDGQLYYAQGDLRGAELAKPVQEEPKAEAPKAEAPKAEAPKAPKK